MAYFQPSIDADGIHVPAYEDILEDLITKYKAIFGEDVYLGVDSKDYQMLSVFARALADFGSLAVEAYNSRNPLYATGDSLDVLASIVGLVRTSSEFAEATVTLHGYTDTDIPAGKKVSDVNGELWTLKEDCTIGSAGTATGVVVKDEPGLVSLVPGYISNVYDVVIGWDGVTNVTIGNVGADTESDEELRKRMRVSLMSHSQTVIVAIESALSKIDGVTEVKTVINDTDETQTGTNIPPHSICAIVSGGDSAKIGQTIFDYKAPGIGTYGGVDVSVVDGYGRSGYTVSFSRPTESYFSVTVTGKVYDPQVDLDALKTQVVDAVFEFGNSLGIGESFPVSKLYPVIYAAIQANGVAIESISIDTADSSGIVNADWDEVLLVQYKTDIDVSGIVMG